jgi:hypothetical protein
MLIKDSSQVEKEFRSFLRAKSLKLSSLDLPIAFDVMAEFWAATKFSNVLAEDGDGIACYEDVTDHGRGTRLEIGLVRLLRLPSDATLTPSPAHRLRLRICYKWDMDVTNFLASKVTFSHRETASQTVTLLPEILVSKPYFLPEPGPLLVGTRESLAPSNRRFPKLWDFLRCARKNQRK